jgi:hypothetical protein
MGISNSGKNKRMGSNSSSIIVCTCHLLWLYPRVQTDNYLLPSRRMELPKSSMWPTLVCSGRVTVIHANIFLDMINIIKLGHTPHGCCWVHRRGQAQGLLAVYVVLLLYKSMKLMLLRSDSQSGVIRIYDGRGSSTPLETIDKLHRFPVHVMAVCAIWYRIYEPLSDVVILQYSDRYDTVISADEGGFVEYWKPVEPFGLPKDVPGLWSFKTETDLYDFKKVCSSMFRRLLQE